MRGILFLVTLLCLAAASLRAQEGENLIKDPRQPILTVMVTPEDSVVIQANLISAIAMHRYKLDGENLITQVTIDTLGNNTIRFYYIHPAQSIDATSDPKAILSAAQQRINRQTTKQKDDSEVPAVKFPEGNYAHSIEFQVDSPEVLRSFYNTALSVWEKRTPVQVKFKFY